MSETIHIEIGRSYAGLVVRIGTVKGAMEMSNITKEEMLGEIRKEIENVFEMSEHKGTAKPETNPSVATGKTDMGVPESENTPKHEWCMHGKQLRNFVCILRNPEGELD